MSTVCIRHPSCRRAVRDRITAWPTDTHPRFFIVCTLGSIGILLLCLFLIADVWALWWLMFQTGEWL